MIKLYSNRRCLITLMPWGEVEHVGKNAVWNPVEDRYAIPGGYVATEKEIRTWASTEGFSVKKCY